MICPVCGTSFHYCSSCSISYNWETTYCSEKCWHASPEYVNYHRLKPVACKRLSETKQ